MATRALPISPVLVPAVSATMNLSMRRGTLRWSCGLFLFTFLVSTDLVLGFPTRTSTTTSAPPSVSQRLPEYKPSPEDDFFRSFRRNVPSRIQYFLRDSGILRFLVDSLTWTTAVPAMVREQPVALSRFLHLSGWPRALVSLMSSDVEKDTDINTAVKFRTIKYGQHGRQTIDVIQPVRSDATEPKAESLEDLILFVHGGAWGSGFPEIYRLAAVPFVERGYSVVFLGYRTYPDGTAQDQADDVVASFQALQAEGLIHTENKVTLMGHSSGSHISAMALLSNQQLRERVNAFVALCGVYDIPRHYIYERMRGVERFSPMAVACGVSKDEESTPPPIALLRKWKYQSPTWLLQSNRIPTSFPDTLIVHGQNDTTVPVESPLRFYQALSNAFQSSEGRVELEVLADVGHADVITQLMFGGVARDTVLRWMTETV